jgi:hypothetical protein
MPNDEIKYWLGTLLVVRALKLRYFAHECNTGYCAEEGGLMKYEPMNIISRIKWCRIQQRLHSVTSDESAGWQAEETGLIDALNDRDRGVLMRKEHRSDFVRYQCGLEDGQVLLRLSRLLPSDISRATGLDQTAPSTHAWRDGALPQSPSRMESRL